MFSNYADYFDSIRDFIQIVVAYFKHGVKNVDQFPDMVSDVWEWLTYTFDFLPPFFMSLLMWFIIAVMICRFLRW